MSKSRKSPADVAPTRLALFGPRPLIPGQDEDVYDALFVQACTAVKPADFLEQIWVQDVVDLEWDVVRLRRLKAQLLDVSAHKGLTEILKPLLGPPGARDLAEKSAIGDPDATKEVNRLLATEAPMDAVMAQTLSIKIDEIERIDRMVMNAEARRNAALYEIERHRKSFAQALRRATEQIEDAEYKEVAENAKQAPRRLAA